MALTIKFFLLKLYLTDGKRKICFVCHSFPNLMIMLETAATADRAETSKVCICYTLLPYKLGQLGMHTF